MIDPPAPAAGGLIAAAGASTRMGQCKALLDLDGEAFAVRLVRAFAAADVAPIIVTLPEGPDGDALRDRLERTFSALCADTPDGAALRLLPNRYPHEGLTGSLRTAVAAMPARDVLVMTPVDAPFATPALIRQLLAPLSVPGATALATQPRTPAGLGHPVCFAAPLWPALLEGHAHGGARQVLAQHAHRCVEVPWPDPRVAMNLNTATDLAEARRVPERTAVGVLRANHQRAGRRM